METLRTSSYMIPVKLESEKGKYMLIHGYTGAMDIVTENLLTQIKHIETENTLPEENYCILCRNEDTLQIKHKKKSMHM